MYLKFFVIAGLSLALFSSCSDDDDFNPESGIENPDEGDPDEGQDPQESPYGNGFFVTNEGAQSAGTITHISSDYQNVEQEVFTSNNPDAEDLGMFIQSMFFDDNGRAYLISSGSNLITVVNQNTFELVGKVDSGLDHPRYGVEENGTIYVTNQAEFGSPDDDYVAVIDTSSFEIQETVNAGGVVENIEEENGLLYIQNAAFGSGNQISVFDPMTNQVSQTITTADGLNSMEVEDGFIYALSSSKLQKINTSDYSVTDQIEFSYTDDSGNVLIPQNLDIENGSVYYTVDNGVYNMDMSATTPAENPLLTYNSNSASGVFYGFEVEENNIYIADAGDFASDSYVKIYDLSGSELEQIDVGVAPNGFYFGD